MKNQMKKLLVSLTEVEVTRKMPVWTPVQYFKIVENITSQIRFSTKFKLKQTDESMTRTFSYYDTKLSSIKIEPQIVKGSHMVWRLRISCWLHIHFITPGNASAERIAEVSTSVLNEFDKEVRNGLYYEMNPDADSWRFKRVVFP